MAKSIYASANGLAQKVKKMYLGIEGVARKVKKGYVGVNGIARLFFSGSGFSSLSYVGEITPLVKARLRQSAGTIGDYAIFVNGVDEYSRRESATDVYDDDLVHSSIGTISVIEFSAVTDIPGSQLIFCGGSNWGSGFSNQYGGAFDPELVITNIHFDEERDSVCAVTAGENALFVGGSQGPEVYCFSPDLTRSKFNKPTGGRNGTGYRDLYGQRSKKHAFVLGGYNTWNEKQSQIAAWDDDLTYIPDFANAPNSVSLNISEGHTDNYAVFIGGDGVYSQVYSKKAFAVGDDLTIQDAGEVEFVSTTARMRSASCQGMAVYKENKTGYNTPLHVWSDDLVNLINWTGSFTNADNNNMAATENHLIIAGGEDSGASNKAYAVLAS